MSTDVMHDERKIFVWFNDCWRCGEESIVWWVECDLPSVMWAETFDERVESWPEVVEAVKAEVGTDEEFANLGWTSSKQGGRYIGFSCPNCHAVFGDWHLRMTAVSFAFDGADWELSMDLSPYYHRLAHLYDEDEEEGNR